MKLGRAEPKLEGAKSNTVSAIDGRQRKLGGQQGQTADGHLGMVGAELQEYPEAPTHMRIDPERKLDTKPDLLERICDRNNMRQAYVKVARNGGAGGVDGMSVKELDTWLHDNYDQLVLRILAGKYRPQPVRRVKIPKEEKGKLRLLGIPTVIDRMVQQAAVQVLTPIYEPMFSDASFGFRPNRSAHDALLRIKELADARDVWICSIDLERFFDTVNQSKLIQVMSNVVKDGRVVSLMHRFLKAGVMVDGVVMPTDEGTPQGGPLSPLLANVLLNELDRELERRGHHFVRYADDLIILKRSRKAAERAMGTVTKFIEGRLFLKVNRDKSYVAHIASHDPEVKYLGYGFFRYSGELHFRVHSKSAAKLKAKVKEVTSRSNGWSLDYRRKRLSWLVNGWVSYFRLADMTKLLRSVDEWLRRRIRCVYWKCWKKISTKYKALMKLGVSRNLAWQWANSRKAYWRIAGSAILARALNNTKLDELGWEFLYQRCLLVKC